MASTPEGLRQVERNLRTRFPPSPHLTAQFRKPQEHAIDMIDLVIERDDEGISALDTLRERCKDGCPFCPYTQLNAVEGTLGKVESALTAVYVARGMKETGASIEAKARVAPIREGMSADKLGKCKGNQAILTSIASIEGDLTKAQEIFTRNLEGGRRRKRRTRRRGTRQRRTRQRRTRGRRTGGARRKRHRHSTRRRRKLKRVF